MKNYRVSFINEHGRRAHKDYKTFSGAMRFITELGSDNYYFTEYDENTFTFEPVPYSKIENWYKERSN